MTKLTTQQYNELLGVDDSYKAPERLMKVLRNRTEREAMFKAFLEAFNYDVSYDWFTDYFQDEHADRKTKKQDFTPRSITELVTRLIGDTSEGDGRHYEPCAGTGGMTIARWNSDRMQHSPFDYRPSWYLYTCEELSDRAIPFLLFNLMVRGMNAIVVHCDVLSRKTNAVYFIQNDKDDHLTFSSLNVMPYTEEVAKFAGAYPIEWANGVMQEAHVESPELSSLGFVQRPSKRGEVSDYTKAIYAMCGIEVTV